MGKRLAWGAAAAAMVLCLAGCKDKVVVLAHNDLGMHCMNEDFSSFMILPPYNTVQAQVIQVGQEPKLLTSGVEVSYEIPGNTVSSTKTNFWTHANALMGVSLAPDIGLTGNGLAGPMAPPAGDATQWEVTGIPVTPIMDDGTENAYPLGHFVVKRDGEVLAETRAVVPVSWEISCAICHENDDDDGEGDDDRKAAGNTALNILREHDEEHGTNLVASQPVMCGSCHAQAPLGTAGQAGVPSLSRAMHHSHAGRMDADRLAAAGVEMSCYACHPGVRTKCLRDVHAGKNMTCLNCHGDMAAVGASSRRPWVDEPRCGDCHEREGFEFEQPGVLFRNAKGHHGVACAACHGSPHASGPAITEADNVQAVQWQGKPGPIGDCSVCHGTWRPGFMFDHKFKAES